MRRQAIARAKIIRDFSTYIPENKRIQKLQYSLLSHAFENLSSLPYDPMMSLVHTIQEKLPIKNKKIGATYSEVLGRTFLYFYKSR